METAKARGWTKKTAPVYTEGHHILPKSWMPNNYIVQLTAKEHFEAHYLLFKAFPEDRKMMFAFRAMCNQADGKLRQRDYTVTAERYEESRKAISEYLKGEGNHCADLTTHSWVHKNHGEVNCIRLDLNRKYGTDSISLGRVLSGKITSHRGWRLKGTEDKRRKGADMSVYKFYNKLGQTFTGTRWDLEDKFTTNIGKLFWVNPRKSCKGWSLTAFS